MKEIEINETTKLIIEQSEYKERTYVNIRQWYLNDSKWLPTKKGFNLSAEKFQEFKEVIQDFEVT
jgi:hypothetical protein